MTEKFIEDCLDYKGLIEYKKGSEKFRQAVRLGLSIQLAQAKVLLDRLDKRFSKRNLDR